jgi:hypothetical protein
VEDRATEPESRWATASVGRPKAVRAAQLTRALASGNDAHRPARLNLAGARRGGRPRLLELSWGPAGNPG